MRESLLFVGAAIFLTTILNIGSFSSGNSDLLSLATDYLISVFAGSLIYWLVWRPCQRKFTLWEVPRLVLPVMITVGILILGALTNFVYSMFTGFGSWMFYAISFYLAGVSFLGGVAATLIRPRERDATG